MKKSISLVSTLVLANLLMNDVSAAAYVGSSASGVWTAVTDKPYVQLPSNKVTFSSLFDGLTSLIERSAKRTLNDKRDLLPRFNKLAHPNGACLKGSWTITKNSPYSGLFKMNSKAIIIARASVALSDTESGDMRGFGMAGKLFPTNSNNKIVPTANFFLIDDLGGTKAAHYTDVEMTNEPKATTTIAVLENIRYALALATTFSTVDSHPTKRQVYEVAEAGRVSSESLKVPKWMMVKASGSQKKIDANDFRDEFNMDVYDGKMKFEIYTADKEKNGNKDWSRIGDIVFTESVVSQGCDHNLHFHHPEWRDDIE